VNLGRLNIGFLFISAGIIIFLILQGRLTWGVFIDMARFWPVLLIAIGIEFLFKKTRLWPLTLLSPLLVMGVVWGVVYSHLHGEEGLPLPYAVFRQQREETSWSYPLPSKISSWSLALNFEAGKLNLDSPPPVENLIAANFTFTGVEPKISTSESEESVEIAFSSPSIGKSYQKKWEVRVSEEAPLNLSVDANAARIQLHLQKVPLKSLRVDADVSTVNIWLGDKTQGEAEVNIQANVTSLIVHVPEECGLSLSPETTLSATNIEQLKLKKKKGRQVSSNYDTAVCRYRMNIQADVSRFRLLTQ